jgi:hypothetical protein
MSRSTRLASTRGGRGPAVGERVGLGLAVGAVLLGVAAGVVVPRPVVALGVEEITDGAGVEGAEASAEHPASRSKAPVAAVLHRTSRPYV